MQLLRSTKPIASWNTAKVTDMNNMFRDASAFNHDISSWTGTAATTAQAICFTTRLPSKPNIRVLTPSPDRRVRVCLSRCGAKMDALLNYRVLFYNFYLTKIVIIFDAQPLFLQFFYSPQKKKTKRRHTPHVTFSFLCCSSSSFISFHF